MTDRPLKEPSILDEPSAFSKPSPRTFNRNDLPAQDLEQLRADNARLRELLSIAVEMTGEPECWYDHHGYCQAHNLEPKGECWVELSRAALSADPAPVGDGPDWEGFGRALMDDFPKGDIDGRDLFDLALNYRLIIEVPGGYDPEEHIDAEGICPEKGDLWFEYNFRGERQ